MIVAWVRRAGKRPWLAEKRKMAARKPQLAPWEIVARCRNALRSRVAHACRCSACVRTRVVESHRVRPTRLLPAQSAALSYRRHLPPRALQVGDGASAHQSKVRATERRIEGRLRLLVEALFRLSTKWYKGLTSTFGGFIPSPAELRKRIEWRLKFPGALESRWSTQGFYDGCSTPLLLNVLFGNRLKKRS